MASSFPKLRTNAIAQYPATKTLHAQNQALRFVDGSDQRYRDYGTVLHEWEVQLDQLNEGEMAAVEHFFAEQQGRFGAFSFTDPWDGQVYGNCSFSSDELILLSLAEMRGRSSFRVVENRE